jgi:corrinoid protein of di/trimethylamine methyltransferase
MPRDKQAVFKDLAETVIQMDEEAAVRLAEEALAAGIDAYEAISDGLSKGMEVVSDLYDREEYFVPEILLCSDAMYAGITVLKPHIKTESVGERQAIVIGVIDGDIHDIGKNIVKIMLEAAGFDVHDLGRSVPVEEFVNEAERVGARIIALSTLMSTTMEGMRKVVELLRERGIRDRYGVMIGGCPCSPAFAEEIGADAFGENASEAVRIARELIQQSAPAE